MQAVVNFPFLAEFARASTLATKAMGTHIGDLKFSVRTEDYNGWLICDGRELSRGENPALFDLIGTSFGGGSSPEMFRLPNCVARVPGAIGDTHNLGHAVGAETHVLSAEEMPSHTHAGSTNFSGSAAESETVQAGFGANVAGSSSHSHTFTTNSTGGGQAHNNMQPTLFVGNMFIFAGLGVTVPEQPYD